MTMNDIKIYKAINSNDIEVARILFREYIKGLGIDLGFQGIEEELSKLPHKYAEPDGTILLAKVNDDFAGIVALWKLEEGVCEMKRLYVRTEFRSLGLGRILAEKLMEEARKKGYTTMKLDTLRRLESANKLYQKLGFRETKPYNYNPQADVAYFEIEL